MTQLIYSISALGIVVVVAVSMQRSSGATEQVVYTNEVLTQLVSVGRDVVDDIARRDLPFDAKVDPDRLPSVAVRPYVHSASELTPADEFGGCTDFEACLDVDDFHKLDPPLTGVRNGLDFTANIEVEYVSATDPNTKSGSQTFAKEITVTVESSSIVLNGKPVSASYSRVLTYPGFTD